MFFSFTLTFLQAQTSPEITDEDLKKYAITMDSVESMKKAVTEIVSEMVRENTVMSVARYNDLVKIKDDPAKLEEAKATPEEIAFLQKVKARQDEEVAKINKSYQSLATDYVGLKTFNAIRKSLSSDKELKSRYDSIVQQLNNEGGE